MYLVFTAFYVYSASTKLLLYFTVLNEYETIKLVTKLNCLSASIRGIFTMSMDFENRLNYDRYWFHFKTMQLCQWLVRGLENRLFPTNGGWYFDKL